jgi:hypothetical protein
LSLPSPLSPIYSWKVSAPSPFLSRAFST